VFALADIADLLVNNLDPTQKVRFGHFSLEKLLLPTRQPPPAMLASQQG
jgi:hypothetical protein